MVFWKLMDCSLHNNWRYYWHQVDAGRDNRCPEVYGLSPYNEEILYTIRHSNVLLDIYEGPTACQRI